MSLRRLNTTPYMSCCVSIICRMVGGAVLMVNSGSRGMVDLLCSRFIDALESLLQHQPSRQPYTAERASGGKDSSQLAIKRRAVEGSTSTEDRPTRLNTKDMPTGAA